jgi:hypothetical protein
VICEPALLPAIFGEEPEPSGAVSDSAADAIARLLWDAAEAGQAGNGEHGTEAQGDTGREANG